MPAQGTTRTEPQSNQPKEPTKDISKKLLRSVIKGEGPRVQELLNDFEWSPEDLGRILWHAVRLGTVESAHLLVEAGADVNMSDPVSRFGHTYLHVLVGSRNPSCHELARLMIERGANVNARNDFDRNVLEHVIREDRLQDLLEKLVKLVARRTSFSREVFDHRDAAKILPWIVEGCSERAAEALRVCAQKWLEWHVTFAIVFIEPHVRQRRWLVTVVAVLDMRFPVDELERHGFTLHLAVRTGDLKLVRKLVNYGFSVNGPAGSGNSPLHEALQLEHSAIAELLLRAGADVNDALHDACAMGSAKNIKVLLDHGADVNVINRRGVTAFSLIDFTGIINDAHRIYIRHLAALVSKEGYVNNGDLSIIESNPEMRSWYAHCTNELQMVTTVNVIGDSSIFSFFCEDDIRELLIATRSYEFEENVTSEFLIDSFPNYGKELALSLEEAKNRKKWFGDRSEALYDSFKNILPDVLINKIVRYLYINDIVH